MKIQYCHMLHIPTAITFTEVASPDIVKDPGSFTTVEIHGLRESILCGNLPLNRDKLNLNLYHWPNGFLNDYVKLDEIEFEISIKELDIEIEQNDIIKFFEIKENYKEYFKFN